MAVAVSRIGIRTRCFWFWVRDRDSTRCASIIVLELIGNSIKGKKKFILFFFSAESMLAILLIHCSVLHYERINTMRLPYVHNAPPTIDYTGNHQHQPHCHVRAPHHSCRQHACHIIIIIIIIICLYLTNESQWLIGVFSNLFLYNNAAVMLIMASTTPNESWWLVGVFIFIL